MSSTLSNAELWLEIRQKRNSRLLETDWTQINDSALSDSKKEEYKIYRQSLRDIPQTYRVDGYGAVVWPASPSTKGPHTD